MQISNAKQQQFLPLAAQSRASLGTRDKLETYINPESDPAKSTEYGRRATGYADFLKDDSFRRAVEYLRMQEGYWQSLEHDQKVAYIELTSERRDAKLRETQPNLYDLTGIRSTSYPTPAGALRLQAGLAQRDSSFHQEVNAGFIQHLQAVDREFDAGLSSVSWADAFRSQVSAFDHHYSLLRRTYEAKGIDTGEITGLYEKALGKLYDYAIARDADRAAKGSSV